MSFVSSKPDPYPTPVDVVVYLISALINRVIKRFYCIFPDCFLSSLTTQLNAFSPDKNKRNFSNDTFKCIFLIENVRIWIQLEWVLSLRAYVG